MLDTRPVLAKGDNFVPPTGKHPERQCYIKEYLTVQSSQPTVQWVKQMAN